MDFSKTDTTSVKVHHAPGGKSNFSLGWQEEQQKKPVAQKVEQPPIEKPVQKPEIKEQKQEGSNNAKTSVKVHNPPGGKSNFTLG